MKYRKQAEAIRDAALEWARIEHAGGTPMKQHRDLFIAINDYEKAVCELAWKEVAASKTMHDEGLHAIREACTQVAAQSMREVIELRAEVARLKAAQAE